jgi:hypothetical protein
MYGATAYPTFAFGENPSLADTVIVLAILWSISN